VVSQEGSGEEDRTWDGIGGVNAERRGEQPGLCWGRRVEAAPFVTLDVPNGYWDDGDTYHAESAATLDPIVYGVEEAFLDVFDCQSLALLSTFSSNGYGADDDQSDSFCIQTYRRLFQVHMCKKGHTFADYS
jgi:hypothetical protein